MTDARHIYLTIMGMVSDELAEAWQVGIRFMLLESVTAPAHTGTLPTFGVSPANVHRTETDWTIESSWTGDTGSGTFNPDDWLNDQVAPTLQASFGSHISNQQKIVALKASPITATGHVADGRTTRLDFTSTFPQGAATGDSLPLECAAVVSWQTGQVGKRGRGRIYLPALTTASLTSSGRYSSATTAALVSMAHDLLEGFAITGGGLFGQWVLPIVCPAAGTEFGVIESISCGDVPDAQRRRRRSLDEVRSQTGISY